MPQRCEDQNKSSMTDVQCEIMRNMQPAIGIPTSTVSRKLDLRFDLKSKNWSEADHGAVYRGHLSLSLISKFAHN
jgi:hypothetical protein